MNIPGETSARTTQGMCSFCFSSGTVTEHMRSVLDNPSVVYTCTICDKYHDFHDKGPNGFYQVFAHSINRILDSLDSIKQTIYMKGVMDADASQEKDPEERRAEEGSALKKRRR